MISLISHSKALLTLAKDIREKRLAIGLTQEGLSERSGVPLATLRKFEQKGLISLKSFLKILIVTDGIEEIINALKPKKQTFNSIDEVLKNSEKITRKRGNRK